MRTKMLNRTSLRKEIVMRMEKVVENRSLGDLMGELRALKKRHDSLYKEHQKNHREFMEHGIGGRTERKRLYRIGLELHEEEEKILHDAQEITQEVENRA